MSKQFIMSIDLFFFKWEKIDEIVDINTVQNSIWCVKPVIFQMWKVLKICSNKKNITIKPLKWNNLNTNLRHAKHFSPQRWIQSCGTEPGKKQFSKKTFLSYSFIQALKICFVFNLQLTKVVREDARVAEQLF